MNTHPWTPVLVASLAFGSLLPAQTTSVVVPAAQATTLGNTSSMFPFSYTNYVRFQQVIGTPHFAGPTIMHGMALRSRTAVLNVPEVQNQGMTVTLADSLKAPGSLDPTYANNVGTNATVVYNGTFNIQRPNTFDSLEFNTTIPFDKPYVHLNVTPLLIELVPTSFQGQACNGGGNGTSFDFVSTDPNMQVIAGKGSCGAPPLTNGGTSAGGYVIRFFTNHAIYPFGKVCAGSSIPRIDCVGSPTSGNASFALTLQNAPAGTPSVAALLLGASSSTWGSTALPWDLAALNMTGCWLTVAADLTIPTTVTAGSASVATPIPASPILVGQSFFAQYFSVANGANPFGAVTTQGSIGTIR